MEISNMIIKCRKELQMTQRELAEKLNVTDKTISRWEVGKSYPDATILPALAKALNISIDELFGDTSKVDLSTNEHNKIDHNQITKFRIFNIVSLALLITGFIILAVNFIVNMGSTISLALFVVGIILTIGSIVLMAVGEILYTAFYKGKFYTKIYKIIQAKWVISYVNTFVLLLSLIPTFFALGRWASMAIFILLVAEIVMAIAFEKSGCNLNLKNKKIFYISSGIILLLSIILSLLAYYYGQGLISAITSLLFVIDECVMTFIFYGYKAVIKE